MLQISVVNKTSRRKRKVWAANECRPRAVIIWKPQGMENNCFFLAGLIERKPKTAGKRFWRDWLKEMKWKVSDNKKLNEPLEQRGERERTKCRRKKEMQLKLDRFMITTAIGRNGPLDWFPIKRIVVVFFLPFVQVLPPFLCSLDSPEERARSDCPPAAVVLHWREQSNGFGKVGTSLPPTPPSLEINGLRREPSSASVDQKKKMCRIGGVFEERG